MLKIEYQIKMLDGSELKAAAYINADSCAHWLLEMMSVYGKVGILSVTYHD
jgi:hypothetical protein